MRKWVLAVVSIGVFGLMAVLTVRYFLVDVPELNRVRSADSRMNQIDDYMKSKGGVNWELRRYDEGEITQTWFMPTDATVDVRDGSVEVVPASESYNVVKVTLNY